jgi:hypothetical protein
MMVEVNNDWTAYLMSPWEVIEPGIHEYPFALKVSSS